MVCAGVLRFDLCAGLLLASSCIVSVQTFRPISTAPSPTRRWWLQKASSSSFLSTVTSLGAVSQRQTFIIDGGELQSFLLHNGDGPPSVPKLRPPRVGSLSLVAGTTDGRRVVGVQKTAQDDAENSYSTLSLGDAEVYQHTLAAIPKGVSEEDAMSTAAAATVGIHCAMPRVENVGGSDDGVCYSGKVGFCWTCNALRVC